jgi:hypothetical protein
MNAPTATATALGVVVAGALRGAAPALAAAALVAAALLFGTGCSWPSPVPPGSLAGGAVPAESAAVAPAAPALAIWPADDTLGALATDASARIAAATGLVVAVGADVPDAIPLLWSERGDSEGWLGQHRDSGVSEWLAINPATEPELLGTVTLHEVLHALGADHIEQRGAGVLSDKAWVRDAGWPLTAADLEAVCSVRDDCDRFEPEAAP